MLDIDIEAEYEATSPLAVDDMKRLLSAGVPACALTRSAHGVLAPIRRDRVVFDASRGARFEFARHMPEAAASAAYIVPLFDTSGDIVDLLAIGNDGAHGQWLGLVAMAGEEEVLAPRLDEALDAHADVMGWLRAGRRGIAIVDHRRAAGRLEGMTIRVASQEHAKRLRTALARPAPRIIVAEAAEARAA